MPYGEYVEPKREYAVLPYPYGDGFVMAVAAGAGAGAMLVPGNAAGLAGTEGSAVDCDVEDGCEAGDVVDCDMAAEVVVAVVEAGVAVVTPALSQGFGGEGMSEVAVLQEAPRTAAMVRRTSHEVGRGAKTLSRTGYWVQEGCRTSVPPACHVAPRRLGQAEAGWSETRARQHPRGSRFTSLLHPLVSYSGCQNNLKGVSCGACFLRTPQKTWRQRQRSSRTLSLSMDQSVIRYV